MTTIQFLKKGRGDLTPSPPLVTRLRLKISLSIIYGKEYLYMFSLFQKILYEHKKKNKSFN